MAAKTFIVICRLPVDLIIVSCFILLFLIYNAFFLHNFVKKVNKTNHKLNLPSFTNIQNFDDQRGTALFVQGPEQNLSLVSI